MEDKLQTLYNNLVKEGYDLPEYNTFKVDMSDPTKSLKLHTSLKTEGYDLPEYDTFLGDMGLNQKKKDIPIPTLSEILQEPSKESSIVKPPLQSDEVKPKDRETTAMGDVLRSLKSGSQRALGGITGTPYFLSSTVLGSVVRPIAKAMGATDEEANIALTSVLMSNPTGVGALGGKDIQDKLINKAKKTEEKMMPIEGSIWQNLKAGEVGKAGELLGRGVAQSIPYLAMTAATAGGGTTAVLSTIGATSAAQQYAETEGQKEPKRLLNAWMYGGFEAAGELVTAGLLRGVGKAFSKGIVKKVDDSFVKAASKELGKAFGLEGSSEAMTQLGQNFTDIVTGVDPNRSLLDGVLDAALIGGFSGGGIGSASIGASVLGRTLASDKEVAQVENNVQQQGTLIDQIESTDSDPVKTALEKRLRTLRYEADKIMDKNYELAKELSPEQHARVAELYSVWNTLQAKIDNKEIISEQEITTTENTIEGIKEEIQSIREAKIAELGELKGEEVKYKIGDKTFKTTEEVESWLDKNYVKQGLDPVWHEPTEKLIDSWVKKNKEKIDQAQVTKKKVKIPEAPVSPVPVPKTPFIEINSQNISEIQNNVLTSLKERNAPPEEIADIQHNLDLIKQSVDERAQREKTTDDLAETGAGVTGQISEILPGEVEGDGGTYEGLLGRRREGNRTPKLSPADQVSQVVAPNGEKSNLSPENHAFVRTPEFKAKFGDWQKGEGSLVLDRNGEPLLVYSGKGKYHPQGLDPAKTDNKKLFFTGDKGLATLYAQLGGKQPVVYRGFVALSEQDLADKGSQINKFHDNQQEYLVSRKDQFIPVGVEEVPKIRKSKTEVQPVQKTETFTALEQTPKVEQAPTTLKTKDDISAYASLKAEEKPEEKGRWDKMSAITGRVMDVLSKIAPDTEIVMLENDEAVNAELTKLGEDPGDFYNGWYHQGKIYLNSARFEESTPIHEAIHPIVNVLRQLNPDKFSKWAKEAGNTKILVDGKKTTYFDYLNATGQAQEITEDEAVVTFLEDFIGGKIDYDKVNKTSVVEAVKQMLTDLLTYFGIDPKALLGADISLDNIDDLTELSRALLKAFEEGRAVTTARTGVSPKVGPIEAGGVQFLNGTAADYPITEGVQGASQKSIALPDGRKVGGMNMPEVVNGFYSPIEKRLLDFKQEKASVNKWKEIIGKGDEATFTGVSQWLSQLKPDQTLTKAEISQFMKDNRIEVVEVEKGEPSEDMVDALMADEVGEGMTREEAREYLRNDESENPTKFQQYQLPGEKENYKEVLVTLPRKKTPIEQKASKELDQLFSIPSSERTEEQRSRILALQDEIQAQSTSVFKSSHFDEPNILVHLRMNTRTDSDGKKVLFLEEVQSDFAQSFRKEQDVKNDYIDKNDLKVIEAFKKKGLLKIICPD